MKVNEVTTQGTVGTVAPGRTPAPSQTPNTPDNTTRDGSTVGQPQATQPNTDMGDTTPAQQRQEVNDQIKAKTDEITQSRERAKAAQEEIQAAKEAEKLANEELALLRKRLSQIT